MAAYGIIGRARGTLVHHASRGNVYLAPEPNRDANGDIIAHRPLQPL
jgi:hypothetical protein